jgi:hypothetical protein
MKLSDKLLFYIFFLLTILFLSSSYFRFIIINDYNVAYEGSCNEITEICYLGCEDENCEIPYYYTLVQKHAANLKQQCGSNIVNCEEANICLPEEGDSCFIIYCNPEIDGDLCETITDTVNELGEESIINSYAPEIFDNNAI